MAGSMRQRSEGSWELRVYVGKDPDGRKRWTSKTFHGTKREAERALAQLVVDAGARPASSFDGTVADTCWRWLAHAAATEMAESTAVQTEGIIRNHIEPGLGTVRLDRLGAADIDAFYVWLLTTGKLKSSTVRRVHGVLSSALSQAVRWRWIATNPARDATPPFVEEAELNPPEPDVVWQLVDVADALDPMFGAWLHLSAHTGARRGILCGLQWHDVDLEAGEVRMRRCVALGQGGRLVVKPINKGRSHKGRQWTVAVDADTIAVLRRHRTAAAERALASGVTLAADAFVFSLEPDGVRPMRPDGMTSRFARVRRQAGIEGVRLHDLRHASVTELLDAGMDVKNVAERHGHANAVMTLNRYAHASAARDRQAAEIMAKLRATARNPQKLG